jgi:hypothetical protein
MHAQRRSVSPTRLPRRNLPTIQEERASIMTSSVSPSRKRTSSVITSEDQLDKLKLKAREMLSKDLVKVPPILFKLRQQKHQRCPTTDFPSIDMFLLRLNSKVLRRTRDREDFAGDLLSRLHAMDGRLWNSSV